MKKILIFAGTTEGRLAAEKFSGHAEIVVCTATEYGGQLIRSGPHLTVLPGRQDLEQMKSLLETQHFDCVIDATHPYAVEVTKNIASACRETGTCRYRLLREKTGSVGATVADCGEAKARLEKIGGNVLLTTGSKELEVFCGIKDYQSRLFVRLLPLPYSLDLCQKCGIRTDHICCMQGPFSEEMNLALIRQWKISVLVTKDSGVVGGFPEKMSACKKAGIISIVIGRPQEEGVSYRELLSIFEDQLGKEGDR